MSKEIPVTSTSSVYSRQSVIKPPELYYMFGSTPCHAVLLLIKSMGIEVKMKTISLEKEENKTPAFLKMNPQHTVPTINDNGFTIGESRAILGYLVDMYAKDDSLYPKEPKRRALVNQRLFFEAGTLDKAFGEYFHGKPTKLFEAFMILEMFLAGKKWVAGEKKTIADYSIASSVASIETAGFNVNKYPNVAEWFTKVQKTFPGYDETVRQGCTTFKTYLDGLRKL